MPTTWAISIWILHKDFKWCVQIKITEKKPLLNYNASLLLTSQGHSNCCFIFFEGTVDLESPTYVSYKCCKPFKFPTTMCKFPSYPAKYHQPEISRDSWAIHISLWYIILISYLSFQKAFDWQGPQTNVFYNPHSVYLGISSSKSILKSHCFQKKKIESLLKFFIKTGDLFFMFYFVL